MKLGLWLLIAVAAFLWFNHAKKQRLRDRARAAARAAEAARARSAANEAGTSLEPIVACAQCGLHVPLSEATRSEAGLTFCSEPHRRLHHAA